MATARRRAEVGPPELRALRPGGRRPTLRDVAAAAGVSQSTTSRALRNQGYVAADVHDRVHRAAAKLGYVADARARHLRQQVSRSVGVLVSDLRNPFYADVAAGASRAARRAGYTVMLMDDRQLVEEELEASEAFASMRVAGVVLTPLSARAPHYLLHQHIPVVEVHHPFAADTCDAVVVDLCSATAKLTEHLTGLGHRRIAVLLEETGTTAGRDVVRGHQLALGRVGVAADEGLQVTAGALLDETRNAALGLLSRPDPPTAVITASARLAEQVWRAAAERGLRMPADLSLGSLEEAAWMTLVTPGVTAVRQDGMALGEAAVTRLLERIGTPTTPVSTLVFRAELTRRGSSGPAGAPHAVRPVA